MEDGRILDGWITASSIRNNAREPEGARLNADDYWNLAYPSDDPNPWIQVNMQSPTSISGIITQGKTVTSSGFFAWVEKYTVKYSDDGVNWFDVNNGVVSI